MKIGSGYFHPLPRWPISVVMLSGTLEQLLAALGQVQHPQLLAGLGITLAQGFQRGDGRVVDKTQVATVDSHVPVSYTHLTLPTKA